jgi:hypothetical protein
MHPQPLVAVSDVQHLGSPGSRPYGNGVLLWFQTDEFDAAVVRAKGLQAVMLQEPAINTNANRREFWVRDPDGYVVVIAGAHGDLAARY